MSVQKSDEIEPDVLYGHRGRICMCLCVFDAHVYIAVKHAFGSVDMFLAQQNVKKKPYYVKKIYRVICE